MQVTIYRFTLISYIKDLQVISMLIFEVIELLFTLFMLIQAHAKRSATNLASNNILFQIIHLFSLINNNPYSQKRYNKNISGIWLYIYLLVFESAQIWPGPTPSYAASLLSHLLTILEGKTTPTPSQTQIIIEHREGNFRKTTKSITHLDFEAKSRLTAKLQNRSLAPTD